MFDNMSKRERVLALAVLVMVPIALLFMGFFWFLGTQKANDQEIIRLSREIKSEERRLTDAQRANRRRIYYRSVSLPNDPSAARSAYEDWIRNLVIDKLRLRYEGLSPREESKVNYKRNDVFFQQRYNLRFKSTLAQLLEFLHEFNKQDLLHRIYTIGITPLTEGTVANKKNIRSGLLSVSVDIDVIRLVDAEPERPDFLAKHRELKRSLEDYSNKIVFRNIFGPTNNTPVLVVRERSLTEGNDVSFTVTATDADENDILEFRLLENQIEGAKLEKRGTKDRSATFRAPALAVGEYNLKFEVVDQGYPPKSSTAEMKLVITEKRNSKPAWKSSFTHEVSAGEAFRVVLIAEDDDTDDNLTFELVESEIEGAALEEVTDAEAAGDATGEEGDGEQASDDSAGNSRQVAFIGPPVEAGEYKFKVKVIDNNAKDAKETDRAFTLKAIPPAVSMSSQTQITSIISKSGLPQVWIYSRLTDELFRLKVGETFEIDKKKWTVREIDFESQQVEIEVNGKIHQYDRGAFLDKPKATNPLASQTPATEIVKDK